MVVFQGLIGSPFAVVIFDALLIIIRGMSILKVPQMRIAKTHSKDARNDEYSSMQANVTAYIPKQV